MSVCLLVFSFAFFSKKVSEDLDGATWFLSERSERIVGLNGAKRSERPTVFRWRVSQKGQWESGRGYLVFVRTKGANCVAERSDT